MTQEQQCKGMVLVVDDHLINRLLMDAMLKKAGWRCVAAEGAGEAMAVLKAGAEPDVIFMDIRMPDIDGYAATKIVRQWESTTGRRRAPILALSADVLDESRSRALEVGMDGYLTKPISLECMTAALQKFAIAE